LAARSKTTEDQVQLDINDEILDGKDRLAEEDLEKELENIALNDPDVIGLAKCKFVVLEGYALRYLS